MNFKNALYLYQLAKNFQQISINYKLDKFIRFNNLKFFPKENSNRKNNINPYFLEINESQSISIKKKERIMRKFMVYKSKIITNVELSVEVLYNMFMKSKNSNNKKNDIKLFYILVFELIKGGVKIKEHYSLYRMNIPFYADESNFYKYYLGIDKDKYFSNIIINESLNKGNYILPVRGNLFVPIQFNNNNTSNLINSSFKNKFLNDILYINENSNNKTKKIINKIHFIGEILYLLRPAIYLSLLAVFRNNTIIPLIINIILDILIYFARMDVNADTYKKYGLKFLLQKLYFYEMRFRNKNFLIYFFREPIFSSFIRPLMIKICDFIFLPNFIKNSIIDLLDYYSNYVFIA